MATSTLESRADELIGQLGPNKLAALIHLLEVMPAKLGAVRTLLEVMIDDDDAEELTEEDRRALRASDEYFRNGGQGIPFEQVVVHLGFTMEQIRATSPK